MHPQLKHLGLTQLEQALPALFETARQEQWTGSRSSSPAQWPPRLRDVIAVRRNDA